MTETVVKTKAKTEVKTSVKRSHRWIWGIIGFVALSLAIALFFFLQGAKTNDALLAGVLYAVTIIVIVALLVAIVTYIVKILIGLVILLISFGIGFLVVSLLEMAGAEFGRYGTQELLAMFFSNPAHAIGAGLAYAAIPFIIIWIIKGGKK